MFSTNVAVDWCSVWCEWLELSPVDSCRALLILWRSRLFPTDTGGLWAVSAHLCELKPPGHLWQLSLLWCEGLKWAYPGVSTEHVAALQAVRAPVPAPCLRPYHCGERDEGAPENLVGAQIVVAVLMRRTNKTDASCFNATH